jgi:hypothetical protein
MPLDPLNLTTLPPESHARNNAAIHNRLEDIERSRNGIGTIRANTYAEAKAQLPATAVDGQMILARGGFFPVLFVYDDEGEGAGAWYKIQAAEA